MPYPATPSPIILAGDSIVVSSRVCFYMVMFCPDVYVASAVEEFPCCACMRVLCCGRFWGVGVHAYRAGWERPPFCWEYSTCLTFSVEGAPMSPLLPCLCFKLLFLFIAMHYKCLIKLQQTRQFDCSFLCYTERWPITRVNQFIII